jgi:hypothetical protein
MSEAFSVSTRPCINGKVDVLSKHVQPIREREIWEQGYKCRYSKRETSWAKTWRILPVFERE